MDEVYRHLDFFDKVSLGIVFSKYSLLDKFMSHSYAIRRVSECGGSLKKFVTQSEERLNAKGIFDAISVSQCRNELLAIDIIRNISFNKQ